jgi:short subunit dehydrogenase-like uncharacterized protein
MVADISNPEALDACFKKTRVCISCVGPFRLYGEPVVASCIRNKTDYVDICGETEFIEKMYADYGTQAMENKVAVIPACGYDSVPADLGCLYTKLMFQKRNATATAIEMFVRFHTGSAGVGGNATTFVSAVLGFASASNLRQLRKRTHRKIAYLGKPLVLYRNPRWEPRQGLWTVPAAVADVPVVKLGQQMV